MSCEDLEDQPSGSLVSTTAGADEQLSSPAAEEFRDKLEFIWSGGRPSFLSFVWPQVPPVEVLPSNRDDSTTALLGTVAVPEEEGKSL